MKTAKRVLAIIMTVFMIVGTCAVAASAAGDLQAQIDSGKAEIKLTKDTTETITVNRDLKINLNGYRLIGEPGKAAIKISGGKVTVTDGQVLSQFKKNVPTMELIQTVFTNSPPAIRITGGSLTVDGVRIVGSMVNVPKVNELVPTGSAIQSYNGATVTIKRSSLYGDYGVNNAVRENTAGGLVTIEDALIASYTMAIKGGKNTYKVADGSEEIIAADRLIGYVDKRIKLDQTEKDLINSFFDARVIIVTKTADQIIKEKKENGEAVVEPTITVTKGESLANVTAPTVDYTWPNTKGTDCSYELVPEAVVLSDGTSAALNAVPADKVDLENKNAQKIRYRVKFKMSDEAKPYIEMFDIDMNWWKNQFDKYYKQLVIDYNAGIETIGDLVYMLDTYGAPIEIEGYTVYVWDIPEYNQLRRALYEIGGAVAYEKSPDRIADAEAEGWVPNFVDDYTGDPLLGDLAVAGWKGTLDRVNDLVEGAKAVVNYDVKNSDKWGDAIVYLINTVYPELYENQDSILKEAIDKLNALSEMLKGDKFQAIINAVELNDEVAMLDEYLGYADDAMDMIEDALKIPDVQFAVNYAKENTDGIKNAVNKALQIIDYAEQRYSPEVFIDGDFVKTYASYGSIEALKIDGKLTIKIDGNGSVKYGGGTVDARGNKITATTFVPTAVDFIGSFTLTAIPQTADDEFLFWANTENGLRQIISTETTFTMNTTIARTITAVFGNVSEPGAYFVNPNGDSCTDLVPMPVMGREGDSGLPEENAFYDEMLAEPALGGYRFTGWPGDKESTIADFMGMIDLSASANDAYYSGNSAFATRSAFYGPEGAILKIRPNCASYIITPTYSLGGDYTITLNDNDETFTATGKFSNIVQMRSNLPGDAYWKDANTGKIVAVTKNLAYPILNNNATLESVAGACPVEWAMTTTLVRDGDKVIVYASRTSSKAIANTGIAYSVKGTALPAVDDENSRYVTSNDTATTGLYSVVFSADNINGRTLYARPYIEFTDGTVEYGDVVQFN